eukprot:NODE_3863_length_1152_cov_131.576288_g3676_i0.p1 GENE.NODE_3863_length_1152_cov_131.576288_g3676_i0~~NODE_3863_length_1152_cov_131.576288_g3676_i0.p1  ORF type:complete len:329 (+),score=42.36 NODE_3863_length_1152_cov_131.576288_g3676_i0:125-988(+)
MMDGEQATLQGLAGFDEGHGKGMMKHPAPLCKLKPFFLGERFMLICRRLIIQYVLVKPFCSVLACIFASKGIYHEGKIGHGDTYVYIALIVNLSVTFAFTALFYFYLATHEILKPMNPFGKFMCVKAVIFLSFWQSVVLAVLSHFGVLECNGCTGDKTPAGYTKENVTEGLQDLLICFEMMVISLFHRKVFTHKPFLFTDGRRGTFRPSVAMELLSQKDVLVDVSSTMKGVYQDAGGALTGAADGVKGGLFAGATFVADGVQRILPGSRSNVRSTTPTTATGTLQTK